MTAPLMDFSGDEPVWLKYAEWVSSRHNKYYEVRVDFSDAGTYVVTKRWGPRPDLGAGQTKQESYASLQGATSEATRIYASKTGKGYVEAPRPARADKVERLTDEED